MLEKHAATASSLKISILPESSRDPHDAVSGLLGGSRGVPVLVPVRASPVPSVVRGEFCCKILFSSHGAKCLATLAGVA